MKRISHLLIVGLLFIITAPPAKAEFEQKWDGIVASAKKEGTVTIYNLWGPSVMQSLKEAFSKKYNIAVDSLAFSRGTELVERMAREKTAGLKGADLIGAGAPTLIREAKPLGLLVPMEQFLILPDVLDPKVWRGNRLPFADKDKTTMALSARITNNIMVNADIIKPGEIVSVKDVLKPQYKNKVSMNDPSTTGSGNAMLATLGFQEWKNLDEAMKYFKDLIANGTVIMRDQRQQIEWMAKEKYPIALAPQADSVVTFLDAGANLKTLMTKEGALVSPGAHGLGLSKEPAHPNAMIVFLNWLLSREGQIAFVKGTHQPLARMDVPLEGVHPSFIPNPKQKLYIQDESMIMDQEPVAKAAAKILAEGNK